MTLYINRGSQYTITADADLKVSEKLPVGTYTVGFDQLKGCFYFDVIDNFEFKGKIYGDVEATAERFLNTYDDRGGGTGVLLDGEKGSGKTLLAKMISIKGYERGIITVVISQPWHGELFNEFVQSIDQPAIFLFDEFEKVYDVDRDQSKILTLLDGTYTSKKMFIMTCNDRARLSYYMLNRPGRFFYALRYRGLTQDFIQEYCEDVLNNKSQIDLIKRFAVTFNDFSFDILKAIVEEMNRYDESLKQVLKYLNVSSTGSNRKYKVTKFELKDEKVKIVAADELLNDGEAINIFNGFTMFFENEDEESDFFSVRFEPEHIIKIDASGKVIAENDFAHIEAEHKEMTPKDYLEFLG